MSESVQPVQCTLVFPERNEQVLLGMGKRGVNLNRWNGFGGKMDPEDASLLSCAVRELEEEAGLVAQSQDLHYHGHITFHWTVDVPGLGVQAAKSVQVHMYTVMKWTGEPRETESTATPTWFAKSAMLFADMAPDNPHWLPLLLEGKRFRGDVYYNPDGSVGRAEVALVTSS
ncbi:MAG: 8-oxo-dGTP diphosphatase [Candidatus Doudnabacteria bacterium]|nr:8-oxo-dGTP diphosphatase [Candidatus Doudnabacteria bacterium]